MTFDFKASGEKVPPGRVERIPPAQLEIVKPFDIESAKKEFEPYRKKIEEMKAQALAFDVKNSVSNELAISMMGQARTMSKKLVGLKDKKLKPHNEFRTKLIAFVKAFSTPLEDIVSGLKRKTEDYSYQQIVKKRKAEKEEREAAEKRQKALDKEAAEAGVESIQLPEVPVDQGKKVQTRTESGSSLSITLEWKGIIEDPAQVPREYCSPDQKEIDAAVKAGVRAIQGVVIKEVPKSRLRA